MVRHANIHVKPYGPRRRRHISLQRASCDRTTSRTSPSHCEKRQTEQEEASDCGVYVCGRSHIEVEGATEYLERAWDYCRSDPSTVSSTMHARKDSDEPQLTLHRCGPRKLAKILNICLRRAEEEAQANDLRALDDCDSAAADSKLSTPMEPPVQPSPLGSSTPNALEPASAEADDLVKSMSAAISYPSPPPFDPSTPSLQPLVAPPTSQPTTTPKSAKSTTPSTDTLHALLVDDNKINRQLLVMFMMP